MSTRDGLRDELAERIGWVYNRSHVEPAHRAADALLAEGWRKMPDRGDLSNFLFTIYDHGTLPNALREADAILAFLDGGQ